MAGNPVAAWPPETLEERVRRLEDAVASLQDTRPLEDRLAERVAARLQSGEALADKVVESRPAPPPVSAPIAPPPAPLPGLAYERPPWLVFDVLAELRTIVRILFDVRYSMAWSTRLTVLVLLGLIFTSDWWCPLAWVHFVGWIFVKVVDLALAFVVYKALSREAQRYVQTRH
jgi:hypothetical protein